MTGTARGRRPAEPRRVAAVPVALALLVAVSSATAVANAPRFAGTTTFTASASATAIVTLPRAASIRVDFARGDSPDLSFQPTRGRLAGFVLTALDARVDVQHPPVLIALQAGLCADPGCASKQPHEYVSVLPGLDNGPPPGSPPGPRAVTLPAGRYSVRSVTDGAPVRMVVRLAGLSGSSSVAVSHRSAITLRTDASREGVGGVAPLRNVGVTHEFARPWGLTMDVMFATFEPHARSAYGICDYRDGAKPPHGYYHAGCPNAENEAVWYTGNVTLRHDAVSIGGALFHEPATWTRGFWTAGVAGTSSLRIVTLWMQLP